MPGPQPPMSFDDLPIDQQLKAVNQLVLETITEFANDRGVAEIKRIADYILKMLRVMSPQAGEYATLLAFDQLRHNLARHIMVSEGAGFFLINPDEKPQG